MTSKWDAILEQSASAFLAGQLADSSGEQRRALAGTLVGQYQLIEEIGRGGMGAVWLAERADGQFEQRVAVKLIKRGMDSDEILARFLRERQILARLDHPNIARLLDGGVAADGMPYFVMEYIAGEPITTWCDARKLSVSERLKLFLSMCSAVQYAHRSLIVHRDIKPSNVLVTETGIVKLMDFGVAKLLEQDGETTATTRSPMTRGYASPEQLNGGVVTTATDVYQMGILLYELLAGQRPWGTSEEGWSRSKEWSEPRRPSTLSTTLPRLKRRLRGDLDSIVLKALRFDPAERYQSPEALADDIERHLTRRPVRARNAGVVDAAFRFVRRHRLRVAAAMAVAVTLVGGSLFYTVRIRQERDAARLEAAKSAQGAELVRQVFSSWSPDAANRGEVNAAAILRSAVRRAETELQGRPDMLAASLSTLGELFANVGRLADADSLLARAMAVQDAPAAPASPDLAATLARRGRLISSTGKRGAEAIATLQRATDMHRELFGAHHIETMRVQRDLALAHRMFGDHRTAEVLLQGIYDALDDQARRSSFGLEVASNLGYVFFLEARYADAAAMLRPTFEQQRRLLGGQNVAVLTTMRYLASTLRDMGALQEAEELYREAVRVSQNLYGPTHPQTGYGLGTLSILLQRKGELDESERLLREELKIIGGDVTTTSVETIRLGAIRLDRGDPKDAERWLRLGLDSLRRVYPAGNADEADALNRLAYLESGRIGRDSDRWYREATLFDRGRKPGEPVFVSDGLHFLAVAHARRGNVAEAESAFRRALAMYRVQLPPDHPYTSATVQGLEQLAKR